MPTSWPSVGDWFSQLLIWPITILSVSSACAAPPAKGATTASAQRNLVALFMRFLRSVCSWPLPQWRPLNTETDAEKSLTASGLAHRSARLRLCGFGRRAASLFKLGRPQLPGAHLPGRPGRDAESVLDFAG